ncbi:conserved exported protein of unknown function [Candidatus Filomicrobium marinum]|uniref:Cytochrome c domain-containing protein n=2 Tax=Filomicrobium TaxID=119044 RepID=A0A0D6JEK5_9HYPH|nr:MULTISPECIES: cytochrome c [Filomicrobium]MCV0368055.1 cytochrome c [Filomicrobium sp.]CFX15442.1 conserved exported protein of unknown function [Candidatus Filomicrobium marinum]CPR17961.1 conserved exported protein of unknown function [Candidatus Filomicrobium marinum]SDO25516.1 Cytochrome C oxidase, cbb3-type, subunit III [Filomicrobium insigne]
MRAIKYVVAVVVMLTASQAWAAEDEDVTKGRQLAERLCSRCHAVGPQGDSPFEPAPPFRALVEKWPDTEVLAEALAEGINVGHPAMPEFVLQPHEIGDLLSYLETLKK